jgi:hypothetical protein
MKTAAEILKELDQVDPKWDLAMQCKELILEDWAISIRMDQFNEGQKMIKKIFEKEEPF